MILGKDRDVKETIGITKRILDSAGYNLMEDKLLSPDKNIWSVHLKDNDSPFYTNGKGSSKENSVASAYCEYVERLVSGFFYYDFYLGISSREKLFATDEVLLPNSDSILNKELIDFYFPDNSFNKDTLSLSNSSDGGIVCLPFRSFNNSEVLFPLEILKNIYASNGLSAGNSEREALVQGLSECIERGVKNRIIRDSLNLPNISVSTLEELGFIELYHRINCSKYNLILKDCSLGGKFPVIGGILVDRDEGTILSSFGCHPNLKVAIERTITELFQGRELGRIEDMLPPSINKSLISDDSNIEDHFINSTGYLHLGILNDWGDETLWNRDISKDEELSFLEDVLKSNGYTYYTRSRLIDDMWVLQTVVPGLSEIYSVDDLNWDKRNSVQFIRDFVLNKKSDNLDQILEWLSHSHVDKRESLFKFLGFHSPEGSSEESFSFTELELLIRLINKDFEEAQDILEFEIDETFLPEERLHLYRALEYKLHNRDFDLSIIYKEDIVNRVNNLFNNRTIEEILPNIPESHHDMLKSYKKFRGLIKI